MHVAIVYYGCKRRGITESIDEVNFDKHGVLTLQHHLSDLVRYSALSSTLPCRAGHEAAGEGSGPSTLTESPTRMICTTQT